MDTSHNGPASTRAISDVESQLDVEGLRAASAPEFRCEGWLSGFGDAQGGLQMAEACRCHLLAQSRSVEIPEAESDTGNRCRKDQVWFPLIDGLDGACSVHFTKMYWKLEGRLPAAPCSKHHLAHVLRFTYLHIWCCDWWHHLCSQVGRFLLVLWLFRREENTLSIVWLVNA